MDLFPVSLAASRVLFFGELHFAERVGHHRKYNEGENGQAAEHGCQEIELHVKQKEEHGASGADTCGHSPQLIRDGLSREADLLMTVIALKGAVSSFQNIAETILRLQPMS